jgi:hypothetical protein
VKSGEVFDLSTWTPLPAMSFAQSAGPAAVALDHNIYVFGVGKGKSDASTTKRSMWPALSTTVSRNFYKKTRVLLHSAAVTTGPDGAPLVRYPSRGLHPRNETLWIKIR